MTKIVIYQQRIKRAKCVILRDGLRGVMTIWLSIQYNNVQVIIKENLRSNGWTKPVMRVKAQVSESLIIYPFCESVPLWVIKAICFPIVQLYQFQLFKELPFYKCVLYGTILYQW